MIVTISDRQSKTLGICSGFCYIENMKNIIIIHGTGGNPEENWFGWMKEKLEEDGYAVHVPAFPTPEDQSLENWLAVFADYKQYIDGEAILIGHSIGVAFILNVLEKTDGKVAAAYFVAGFTGNLGLPDFDPLNATFADKGFDWEKISDHAKKFTVLHGNNDPYVPSEKGKFIAEQLHAEFHVIEKGGHLNADAGYTRFPFLLDLILKK